MKYLLFFTLFFRSLAQSQEYDEFQYTYTAKQDGLYQVLAQLSIDPQTPGLCALDILKEVSGSTVLVAERTYTAISDPFPNKKTSALVKLNEGDKIIIKAYSTVSLNLDQGIGTFLLLTKID